MHPFFTFPQVTAFTWHMSSLMPCQYISFRYSKIVIVIVTICLNTFSLRKNRTKVPN